MERFVAWLRVARAPLALPTVAAVMVGTLYAVHDALPFRWAPVVPALAAAFFAHAGASVLRDVFDRLASGAPRGRDDVGTDEALLIAAVFWGLAFAAGAVLVPLSGSLPIFLVVGALGLTVAYAAPPFALSRLGRGLGEVAAFLGLGVLPVSAGYAAQAGIVPFGAVLASLPVAFAATAVLYADDLSRLEADRAEGRMTAAVLLGPRRAGAGYAALVLLAALAVVLDVALGEYPPAALAGLLGVAWCASGLRRSRGDDAVTFRRLRHASWIGATICALLISAGFVATLAMRD